ncbi:serpin B5-like [Ochlerotatus camptorhynchus]|uniref:serpin B5-like n=1 Tax=Ochlerotatus camptorhynchus TaxID=644619 RepID=UPI0031CF3C33
MESQWKLFLLLLSLSSATSVVGSDQENIFALELFKQVYSLETTNNFALSPSIFRATLTLLYQIANWNVATEMQQALLLPQDRSEAATQLKTFLSKSIEDRQNFVVAAQLYRDPSELSLKFLTLLNGYLKPEVTLAPSSDPNTVITVSPKVINMPNYNLLVSSAFNLSAAWKNKFNPSDGRAGVFKFTTGYYQTHFMKQTARFGIVKLDLFTALEMQYDWHSDLSMILVMPNDEDVPLATLVQQLNLDTYRTIDSQLRQRFVDVAIPKFSIDSNVQLGMSMARMGMVSPFLANAFDLYRFRGSGLGPVEQAGSINVLEGGTIATEDAPKDTLPTALLPVFRADRPFLFLLRKRTSKEILVIGHYSHFTA